MWGPQRLPRISVVQMRAAFVCVATCLMASVAAEAPTFSIHSLEQDDAREDRDMEMLAAIDNTADVFLQGETAHEQFSSQEFGGASEGQTELGESQSSVMQTLKYTITVTTAIGKDAGTKNPVYATLYGTNGDTGEISLIANDSPYSQMGEGKVAIITRPLKDVGTITKVRLRNPSTDNWLCKSIKIQKAGATTEFAINKWLASPKQTTRWAHAEVEYTLMVKTGSNKEAGTKEPQYITIYGAGGSTGVIMLKKYFERGTMVSVRIKARDVGKPSMIKLISKGTDAWRCRSVRIVTPKGSFKFTANKWVSKPEHTKASIPVDKLYTVWADTGSHFDDGSRGAIFIQMFGTAGATAVHLLAAKGFEHGKKVAIELSAKDVGRVTKVKLSTKSKDGWHCKTLDILYGAKQRAHFDVNSWVQYPMAASLNSVADVPYRLLLKTVTGDASGAPADINVNLYGTLGVTRTLSLKSAINFKPGSTQRVILYAKDVGDLSKIRLSTRQTEGWTCKDIIAWKDGKAYPFSVDKTVQFPYAATVDTGVDIKYSLAVMTGKQPKSESTAMVYITLYGTRGESRFLPLKSGFGRGSTETVVFKTRDVGKLTRIKLTSTSTDGWFCKHVLIRYNGQTAFFKVGKWLDAPNAANIFASRNN